MEATPRHKQGQVFDLFADSPDQHEDPQGWLAWRDHGVGGSEIKMLLDEDPYRPGDEGWQYLWRAKMGYPLPERTEALMLAAERGHALEPIAAGLCAKETGYIVDRVKVGQVYQLNPRVRSTLDGHIYRTLADAQTASNRGTLEIKTVSESIFRQIISKGPRKGDILQLQQNMLVDNSGWGGLFYLHPDSWRRIFFPFVADHDVQQLIVETIADFWGYIESGTPPPLKKKARKVELPEVSGDIAEITDPRFFLAFQDLAAAERILMEAGQLKDEAQHTIALLMKEGHLEIGEGYGRRVYLRPAAGRKTFDKALLQHHHPEIDVTDPRYYKVGADSTYFRVFQLKEGE